MTALCSNPDLRRRIFGTVLLAAAMLPGAGAGAAEANPVLTLVAKIPLPDAPGRFDHLTIDLARNRLFVTEVGNNTIDVIDLTKGARIRRISGLSDPQGIVYAPSAGLVFVGNGGDGTVRMFRGADFAAAGMIDLGDDADNVRLVPATGRVVVGYGGGLAVIDPARRVKVIDVPLRGHPEGFQISPDGNHAFVNIPDSRQIAVVDISAGKILQQWPQTLRANFPMALDMTGKTLATVFRNPARLVLLETDSGKVISQTDTCDDADDVFFDAKRLRIYVSCGEGFLDVFQQNDDALRRLETVPTSSGARTSLLVPELDRLFVAARAGWFSSSASILVFGPIN